MSDVVHRDRLGYAMHGGEPLILRGRGARARRRGSRLVLAGRTPARRASP